METTEEKKIHRTVKDKNLLKGQWRLKYVLVNRMGAGGFSGRMLTTYTDALTGASRFLHDVNGQRMNGYMIEKQITIFDPENNMQDRNILDWLIGHPDVWVEQEHAKLEDRYMDKKNENSRIQLVNLDHQSVENLEEEDYIDRLIGKIVTPNGVHSISLARLRFILAKLNKPYYEAKYMTNEKIEKQMLQKRLKTYVRSGIEKAKEVDKIIENLEAAKIEYEIKEMVRHNILYIANGMFKYESHPIGISTDSVVQYFNQNPDLYNELNSILYKRLQEEIKSASKK